MIRKAEKNNFQVRKFSSQDHLDDLESIWTSLPTRSGRPLTPNYRERAQPFENYFGCKHGNFAVGVAFDGRIVAYTNVVVLEQFSVINQIMGHGDYLTFGIMNLLLFGMQEFLRDQGVLAVNYLHLESATTQLRDFKLRNGFKEELPIWNFAV
jgi:hypothetical protein